MFSLFKQSTFGIFLSLYWTRVIGTKWFVDVLCRFRPHYSFLFLHLLTANISDSLLMTFGNKAYYPCNVCKRGFTRKDHLKRHIAEQHATSEEHLYGHRCVKCHRKFKRKDHLKKHFFSCIRLQHRYQCSECSQKFVRRDMLEFHSRKVHDKEVKISLFNKCLLCEAVCESLEDLRHHIAEIHEEEASALNNYNHLSLKLEPVVKLGQLWVGFQIITISIHSKKCFVHIPSFYFVSVFFWMNSEKHIPSTLDTNKSTSIN